MFEFDQYQSVDPTPAVRVCEKIDFVSGIRKRALLIWSEHCIECAAPECFQSCDLYKARPDERCRRFENGMRRNNYLRGHTGSAAEIVFGKWGKLETRGNTVLINNRLLTVLETVIPRLQPLINVFGRIVRRLGGSAPWTSLSFELFDYLSKKLQASDKQDTPDGFLIEIVNPESHDTTVKFSCAVSGSQMLSIPASGKAALPVWKKLTVRPGYNRFFIPYKELRSVVESRLRYNISFTPEEESGTHLVFVSTDFVTVDDAEALLTDEVTDQKNTTEQLPQEQLPQVAGSNTSRPAVKCVIFDLDNTLWDGVLVEGDVALRSPIPDVFKELDKRGILISVASKNSEKDALDKLDEFGLREYLVYPVINWNQKSRNIKWLREKLSIGADTLLFIDDSPFEREEVAEEIAEIEVLPDTAIESLLGHPRVQGGRTAESGKRRLMYQQQAVRNEAALEFGEDYQAFLKSCEIIVTIGQVEDHQRERVFELLQRTNQLNFSGNKYARESVEELLQDDSTDKHVIHCSDKYGDYGLVGFAISRVTNEGVTVQDFMLSCRVQGKLIEKAFFSYLVDNYTPVKNSPEKNSKEKNSPEENSQEKSILAVNFLPTERNVLAQSVLREIGFAMPDGQLATLESEPGQMNVDFLTLRTE